MPIITDSADLANRIEGLKDETFVTVDTEFVREKVYYPLLCLIQIAGSKDALAIDPLAKDLDLKPLLDLFKNKKIMKVFHAAQQDMEVIYNLMGRLPEPVFDTQVAALVLGHGEAPSYAKLVKEICHHRLDKSSRFTDWAHRPLSEKQVAYAISDVVYLRDIYEKFATELEEKGRTHWLKEEMENLLDARQYELRPEDAWQRLRIKSHISPESLAAIKDLAAWREMRAQQINMPRGWVMKDDILLEIGEAMPQSMEELGRMRRLSSGLVKNIGEDIVRVIKKSRRPRLPSLPRLRKAPPKVNPSLVALLKVLLKMRCEKEGVAQKVVVRGEELDLIAALDRPDVPAMHGWRYEVFGRYAIALKKGKIALAAEGNKIVLLQQAEDNAHR